MSDKKMRLSWFLVKTGLEDADVSAIIEESSPGSLQSFKLSALSKERDSLFVKPSQVTPPKWRAYVEPHVDNGDYLSFSALRAPAFSSSPPPAASSRSPSAMAAIS